MVNDMEGAYKEYVTEKAIVRIYPGKLTEEERKVVWENAARRLLREAYKAKAAKAEQGEADASGRVGNRNSRCGA